MSAEVAEWERVVGIAAGDREAFRSFYERFRGPVWRFVARLLGADAAGVADVVQETFMAVIQHAGQFDPQRGSPEAWLYGIAHNAARQWWRKGDRRRIAGDAVADTAVVVSRAGGRGVREPDEELAQCERVAEVRDCLAELPADYAASLLAKYVDGHSVARLAGDWGESEEAVRSRLARARRAFRERFERRNASDDQLAAEEC